MKLILTILCALVIGALSYMAGLASHAADEDRIMRHEIEKQASFMEREMYIWAVAVDSGWTPDDAMSLAYTMYWGHKIALLEITAQ